MVTELLNKAEVSRAQEITQLHNEIGGYLKMSLEKAIRIGELLVEQKNSMKHGGFMARIKDNLPFTDRTARNYMRLYKERDRLKTETVSDLTGGYNLLSAPLIELKKEDQKEKLRKEGERIEYAKEHPEECPVGEVRYGKTKAGYDYKETIVDQFAGLPIIHFDIIDPEYHRVEVGAAPFELSFPISQALFELRAVKREVQRAIKKFGPDVIKGAYTLDCHEGQKYIYPELMQAWEELKKVMARLEA